MKNKYIKIVLTVLFVIVLGISGVFAFSFRNMTLDFIQISDTHITDREDTSYKALGSSKLLLKDAIEQINEIKGLDFVLFTGDLVDSATVENYDNYYNLLSKLKYPSLNAFGAHDFYGMEKEEVLDIVKQYNPNYIFDKTYYALSPKTDYRIIVLDGVKQDITTANGELSEEQLQFLDKELSQNQDKVVLVALHYPSVQPFISNEHSLLNADKMNAILTKYKNPIIVVSGHYHATKIRVAGNIVFVSTPALVTYPMAFRHIKITNFKDRVKYEFEFIPVRLEDVKEKNRQSVISYSTLEGGEKDKNNTFYFYKKHPKSQRYKLKKIKSFQKETKTSKKDIKKYSQIQNKQKAQKPKKEKIKKQKIEEPKTSFKQKFLNLFKRKKTLKLEET